jgi:plasmid stabilization system protein ParE
MSAPPRYVLTPQAQADVEAIVDYLVTELVPAATIEQVVDRLYQAFALLASQPGIGHRRPQWTRADVRFWAMTTDPYLIIYRERVPLEIVRVWNARRDPRSLTP